MNLQNNMLFVGSYYSRFTLFVLSALIIFSGWYFNNLFSGHLGESLWKLVLVGDTNLALNNNHYKHQELLETRNIVCYIGIFLAFLNYFIFPKLGSNVRLKNNRLFMQYLKSFTSYDFNR